MPQYNKLKLIQAAKVYLEMRGYKIIEQNYSRSHVEINIVAYLNNTIYFIDTKYIDLNMHSYPLEIPTTSDERMRRLAAELWTDDYKWNGDYQFATIELSGNNFTVISFMDNAL